MIKYEIISKNIEGSDGIVREFKYKLLYPSGMYYHAETSDKVIEILEHARMNRIRLTLDYGDTHTGESSNEIYDRVGFIGKSTGSMPIPLLVYNNRSYGGAWLMDDKIIKIETSKGKNLLYVHENYHKKSEENPIQI